MITHLVLFRLRDDADDEAAAAILDGLAALPGQIPEIRSYRFGRDLDLVDGTWDIGLAAEFDSVDDWRTYRDHPAHQAFIAERIAPAVAERVSVQFERSDP